MRLIELLFETLEICLMNHHPTTHFGVCQFVLFKQTLLLP